MNDLAAFILFCMSIVTFAFATLWVREMGKRKRIENYLRGVAAAQGLTGPELSGDVPFLLPGKHRMENPRMEQLESQMDQMAQQMDRLVESQEFLSRVLADRDRLPDPRLRTPH